jgi:hypothetical protein
MSTLSVFFEESTGLQPSLLKLAKPLFVIVFAINSNFFETKA